MTQEGAGSFNGSLWDEDGPTAVPPPDGGKTGPRPATPLATNNKKNDGMFGFDELLDAEELGESEKTSVGAKINLEPVPPRAERAGLRGEADPDSRAEPGPSQNNGSAMQHADDEDFQSAKTPLPGVERTPAPAPLFNNRPGAATAQASAAGS